MELPETVVFSLDAYPNRCYDAFRRMKESGECCDVRINLENCSILAHRVILHAVFPGLKDLLEEKNTGGNEREINAENIDPGALRILIDFAYSFRLEISNGNVKGLLLGALQLKADEIINACCDFLSKRLNAQNAIKRLEFAENLHCTTLVESCRQFIKENFDEVSLTDGFLQAPFSFIKSLICADDLRTSCEETVFEAMIRWVEKCPERQKDDLPELLSHIRLSHIKPEYLIDNVATHECIRTSLVCRDLLDDAKNYHMFPKKRNELTSFELRPRKRMRLDPEYLPQGNTTTSRIHAVSKCVIYSIQYLNTETCKWERPRTLEQFYHTYTVTSSSDMIYFSDMEGLTSHNVASSHWSFDRKVYNSRVGAGSAVLQNKLYVCGGTDVRSCFNLVSCYDLTTKRYEPVPPMNSIRVLPGIVVLGQNLYILGGLDSYKMSQQTVEKYDPHSKTWTVLASMHFDRYGMGCTTFNGRIYVCGGRSIAFQEILSCAEVYDPVQNLWELISPMKTPRYNFSLASDGKKLYAIGGCLENQLLHSTEVYDPHNDVWESGPDTDSRQKYVQAFATGYPVKLESRHHV